MKAELTCAVIWDEKYGTETHSSSDKSSMDGKAREHIDSVIFGIVQIRRFVSKLVNEMDTFKLGNTLITMIRFSWIVLVKLETMTVYISDQISGEFLTKVLIHEIGHCIIFSFY